MPEFAYPPRLASELVIHTGHVPVFRLNGTTRFIPVTNKIQLVLSTWASVLTINSQHKTENARPKKGPASGKLSARHNPPKAR